MASADRIRDHPGRGECVIAFTILHRGDAIAETVGYLGWPVPPE
jgi:hypothetical protein